jgi:hypothetical protein
MLFLAVSAGFFVENQREHYVEHNRARQYASFLYNDLIKDSVHLSERTNFMSTGTLKLDTLISILKSFRDNDTTIAKIYTLTAYAYLNPFFGATTTTMEQLKNSGSLRYFSGDDLVSNFSKYDAELQKLKGVEDRNTYLNEDTRIFLTQFLDLKNISRFTISTINDSLALNAVQPGNSIVLRLYKKDTEHLEQYANLCALKQLDWNTRIALQYRVLNCARNLIASLKKHYHLELAKEE